MWLLYFVLGCDSLNFPDTFCVSSQKSFLNKAFGIWFDLKNNAKLKMVQRAKSETKAEHTHNFKLIGLSSFKFVEKRNEIVQFAGLLFLFFFFCLFGGKESVTHNSGRKHFRAVVRTQILMDESSMRNSRCYMIHCICLRVFAYV